MLEAAFRGGKRYWILLGVWAILIRWVSSPGGDSSPRG